MPVNINALLQQNQDADLLRFTTAGSVDDGKSTLIGRLLSDCKGIYEDQLAALQRDSKRLNREEVDLALLMDGLKAAADDFLERTVSMVLSLCEGVLGVLDGLLGTVNKILGLIQYVVNLLTKISDTIKIIVMVLRAIAAALAATVFGTS